MKSMLVISLCFGLSLMAQEVEITEEITVQTSKMETPLDEYGNTVTVITAEEIERQQWRTVADVLHITSGISLVQTGAPGGVETLFMRGANSQNTLVLLNGARLNDAAAPGKLFDFAHLSTAGIARIEVVKGSQSTLYGSDASAGVINIILKDGAQPEYHVDLEGSDESDIRASAHLSDQSDGFRYAAGISYSRSDNISAQAAQAPGFDPTAPLEDDEYLNGSAYANLTFDLGDARSLSFGFSYTDAEIDLDASNGDDPNSITDYQLWTLNSAYEAQVNANWGYGLYLSRSQTDRENLDTPDPTHPFDAIDSEFRGVNTSIEFRNTFELGDNTRILAGAALEQEEGEGNSLGESAFGPFTSIFDEEAETLGVYAQARFSYDSGFHASLGARFDDHDRFGSATTYQASIGQNFESGTKIRAFYGTNFQAPSVFQLYSDFGNNNLVEETGDSLEVSVSQSVGSFEIGALYFDNTYEDLIDFGFNPDLGGFTYVNLADQIDTEGFEIFAGYSSKYFQANATYEDLDADRTNDFGANALIRRFQDKASLLLSGRITDQLQANANVLRYGDTEDTNFQTFANETISAYTLVNLGLSYTFEQGLSLRLRAENLTDEDYQRVLGYSTYGRRIFMSARYTF